MASFFDMLKGAAQTAEKDVGGFFNNLRSHAASLPVPGAGVNVGEVAQQIPGAVKTVANAVLPISEAEQYTKTHPAPEPGLKSTAGFFGAIGQAGVNRALGAPARLFAGAAQTVTGQPTAKSIFGTTESFPQQIKTQGVGKTALQAGLDIAGTAGNAGLAPEAEGFFNNLKVAGGKEVTLPAKTVYAQGKEAVPQPQVPENIRNMNKSLNQDNTIKAIERARTGEAPSLEDPKRLKIAQEYNGWSKNVTPDSKITVYRVGNQPLGDEPAYVGTDPVSLVKHYGDRGPLQQTQVRAGDLHDGGGLGNEFVYVPPKETSPVTPAAPELPQAAQPSAVEKLVNAVGQGRKERPAIEAAQSAARSQRVAIGSKILAETPGEEGFIKAKRALAGELTPETTPIKSQLNEADVKQLAQTIADHPNLDFYQKINAHTALGKIFEGRVPQPAEMTLLEKTFGPDLVKAVLDNRTNAAKWRELGVEGLNVPRALRSTVDFSAMFRQGLPLTAKHPVIAVKAARQMFAQTFSPKNFAARLDEIQSSPQFPRYEKAGGYLSDPRSIAKGIGAKEEAFMTDLLNRIPIIKQTIGAITRSSERSYVAYLNEMRWQVFNDVADKWQAAGISTPKELNGLAEVTNVASGRGGLGRLEKIAPELNGVFFSPRNMAARIQMLNPAWYAKLPPAARKEAIGNALATVGVGLSVLGLAKMAGAEVEADPRSTDFGKIKIGNQRWDIWGGFQQYARFAAQLITGEKKTATGMIPEDRLNNAVNFVRGKLAPAPATAVDIAEGTNAVGQPVTPGSIATNLLTPFIIQDTVNAIQQGASPAGVAGTVIPGVFGVGTQNYAPPASSTSGGASSAISALTGGSNALAAAHAPTKVASRRSGVKSTAKLRGGKRGGRPKGVKSIRTRIRKPKRVSIKTKKVKTYG